VLGIGESFLSEFVNTEQPDKNKNAINTSFFILDWL